MVISQNRGIKMLKSLRYITFYNYLGAVHKWRHAPRGGGGLAKRDTPYKLFRNFMGIAWHMGVKKGQFLRDVIHGRHLTEVPNSVECNTDVLTT